MQKGPKPSKCKKLRQFGYLVFVAQNYTFTTYSQPQQYFANVFLHITWLHEQTRSKNGLYRLCMSSECKEIKTFAFRAKKSKVVQMQKLHHICYPTVYGTNLYFRHTFTTRENTLQMCSFTSHLPVLANGK